MAALEAKNITKDREKLPYWLRIINITFSAGSD